MAVLARQRRAGAVPLVLLAGLLAVPGCGGGGHSPQDVAAVRAAQSFLAHYVDPDGRVVRRDQGGDTVSEGVGYALLLSVGIGDRASFDRVWGWASGHLLQPSGVLAGRWVDGAVADAHSAGDADLQAAWALTRAGRVWGPSYTAAATTLAHATADQDIGYDDAGKPLLSAGSWAKGGTGSPLTAEPGYWTAPAVDALATLTGDNRWRALNASDAATLRVVTGSGSALPPDWIIAGGGATAAPAADPSTHRAPQCGQDGLRAVIWSALDPALTKVAARWSSMLAPQVTATPIALDLHGGVADGAKGPLVAVAAAAAARAAGSGATVGQDLAAADRTATAYPTYYGSAWDALGRLLLTTDRLAEPA